MNHNFSFQAAGNYIQGEFRIPSADTELISSRSPADLKDHIGDFNTALSNVDLAVNQQAMRSRNGND